MFGFLMSIIAGAVMSIQGVFNTRLSEKTGLFESSVIVQGTAFIASLIIMLIWGKGNIKEALSVDKLYLTGGILGTVITVTVMLAMGKLSPTMAVSVILISQLLTAGIIDGFGLFGTEKIAFGFKKILGLISIIGGIILFKI